MILCLIAAALALAWANGANDNFKGVATLHGSGTLGYRAALGTATVATLLGGTLSLVLANGLLQSFSGRGLVPQEVVQTAPFQASVASAGALTILLATRLGLPTSTTHALTGALLGIAWQRGEGQALGVAWQSFMLPLLLSPPLAVVGAAVVYRLGTMVRSRIGLHEQSCACVEPVAQPALATAPLLLRQQPATTRLRVRADGACPPATEPLARITAAQALNGVHWLSGATVCFARAVNDTPKIAACLLVVGAAGGTPTIATAVAMAAGGVLAGRRVAETISKRITPMNSGQGAAANITTAALVLFASRLGLPVSTTHVSCGAIIGIGAATGGANWRTIGTIALAWLTTLPLSAAMAAGTYWCLA